MEFNLSLLGILLFLTGAEACKRVCGYNYDPVCGSDRVRYNNRCLFQVANCTAGGSLTIIQEGPCPKHHHKMCKKEKRKLGKEGRRLGQFIPRCDADGNYEQIQSHEGINWCVDKFTGQEVENTRKSGFEAPQCTSKTCKSYGKLFRVGDKTKALDGCNTCTCLKDGHMACTEMACLGRKPKTLKKVSTTVETKCWSLFDDVRKLNKYTCGVDTYTSSLISVGGQLKIKLSFDHCKSPLQAFVYKVSSSLGGEDKILSQTFTQANNVYKQDNVGLKVNFGENLDENSVNVTLFLIQDGSDTKVMQGTFPASKADCSWFDKMSDKSQLSLILGVSVPPFVILLIALKLYLRKRCQRRANQTVGVYTVMRT